MEYTLSEIQRKFDVAAHVLIHLCEKEVINPEVQQTEGRGKFRKFSQQNVFEFALALELRKYEIPLSVIKAILHILHASERMIKTGPFKRDFPEPIFLAIKSNLHIFDGELLFFETIAKLPKGVAKKGTSPTVWQGFNVKKLINHPNQKLATVDKKSPPEQYLSCLTLDLTALAQRFCSDLH